MNIISFREATHGKIICTNHTPNVTYMKRLLPLLLITITSYHAFSQTGVAPSAAQTLRLARATYEQGRLHEVPAQLNSDVISKMTQLDQVAAYTLLCLSYIYLEESAKADENMQKIL